jgi:hypothetical protein
MVSGWLTYSRTVSQCRVESEPLAHRCGLGAAVVVAAVVVLVSACSGGSSANGPSTFSGTRPPSSTASTSTVTSSSPTSSVAPEAADRLAVEQAWNRYWTVHQALLGTPAAGWPAAVDAVAVDPTRAQVLSEADLFTKSGLRFYGQVVSHPYWSTPIDGKTTAVMGDCGDYSHYGTLYVKSGSKRTVGVARNNTRVTLVKGSDGTWRVQKIEYLLDLKC